ncbi:uncharacterized protein LOC144922120 isoform X1 [Branchiostoma floridae x Branchiostoma belcheri]
MSNTQILLPRLVPVKTSDTMHLVNFITALNHRCRQSLWMLQTYMMKTELPVYLHQITNAYMMATSPNPTVFNVAEYVGKQPSTPNNPAVWVLGPDVQLGSDGVLLPKQDHYIWDVKSEPKFVVSFKDVELQDRTGVVLRQLLLAMKSYLQSDVNWPAGAVIVGAVAMSLHYDVIMTSKGKCPVVMATGPPAVGKTTALKAALATVGRTELEDFSEASALTEAATSSLPFGWDDPLDEKELGRVIMKVFNKGGKRTHGTRCKKPKSIPVVTANFQCCDTKAMTSRLTSLPFIPSNHPHDALTETTLALALEEARAEAPKAISSLIALGEEFLRNDDELSIIEKRLETIFPPVALRTTQVYALPLWFTQKCLSMANLEEEMDHVWEYFATTVTQLVTQIHCLGATAPAAELQSSKAEVIDSIERAVQKMNLKQINMSIKIGSIKIQRQPTKVVAINPDKLLALTGDRRFHRDELKRTVSTMTRPMNFLSEKSSQPFFKKRDGKDLIGIAEQKHAVIIPATDAPSLVQALKERMELLREDIEGGNADASTQKNGDTSTQGNAGASTQKNANTSTQGNAGASTQGNDDTSTQKNANASTQGNADTSTQKNAGTSTQGIADASTQGNADASTQENANASTKKNANASTQKNADMSTQKNGDTSTQKNGNTSIQGNADASTQKNGDTSTQKNADTSTQKNGDTFIQGNADTSTQKNGDTSTQKNADTSTQGNADASTQGNADTSTQKNADTSTQKNGDTSTQKNGDTSTQGNADASTQKNGDTSTQGNADASTQGNADTSTQKNADTSTQGNADASTQGNADTSTQKNADTSTQGNADASTQGNADTSTQKNADTSTQGNADASTQGNADTSTQKNADTSTQGNADASTQGNADTSTQKNADTSTQGNADASTQGNADASTRKSTRKRKVPVKMALWKKMKKN